VPVDPAVAEQLEATADAFVESVVDLGVHSPAFTGKVGSITRMGERGMREAAAVSNRMLDRPVEALPVLADAPGRDHQRPLPQPGRAAEGQRRHRAGEDRPVGRPWAASSNTR